MSIEGETIRAEVSLAFNEAFRDYLEKMARTITAVKLTAFHTQQASIACKLTAFHADSAAKEVNIYLSKPKKEEIEMSLMGFPIGWLDLKPSETHRSRNKSTQSIKR